VALVPVSAVLITFLFWYQTWFGRPLSDREMESYLADTGVPHKTQHALAQLADRVARGDPSVRRWYPQLLHLASAREVEFRMMAAWVMGQDNKSLQFHKALGALLEDPEPMVQWNAALALTRFQDASGESALRMMLQPWALGAPQSGNVAFDLKEHDPVRRGSVVARIRSEGSGDVKVLSPVVGFLERQEAREGDWVERGQAIALLAPSEEQVWESLRGLYLVGGRDALVEVDRFARGVPHMSDRIRQQAGLTAQAIRTRAGTSLTGAQ